MAADSLVFVGVVISGIVSMYTGWFWMDSVMSLVIIVVIISGTWVLLKESLRLSLDEVPCGVDLKAIKEYLSGMKGIQEVQDLHMWILSTTNNSLTAHLVLAKNQQENLLPLVQDDLFHKFNIVHATIQLEDPGNTDQCLHTL